jgi:hypothetical protein
MLVVAPSEARKAVKPTVETVPAILGDALSATVSLVSTLDSACRVPQVLDLPVLPLFTGSMPPLQI